VSNKFQAAAMIETTRDRFGRLDILVHHAQVAPQGPLLSMDEWEWRRTVEVNLGGAFLVAQLCGRVMADEEGGAIALFADPLLSSGSLPAYAVTQIAVAALSKELAAELAASSVTVFTFSLADVSSVISQLVAHFS
jgi:3-oxoacyl-[acyl-carrier protein] reductase